MYDNKENNNETQNVPESIITNKIQIDSDFGALVLIDMLYNKGKINKTTYQAIQKKYNNKD